MTDLWSDLVLTAIGNMRATLATVLPGILAMLALVIIGALLGWIAGTLIMRIARALKLDDRSRAGDSRRSRRDRGAHAFPAAASVRAPDSRRGLARGELPGAGDAHRRGQRR